MTDGKKGFDAEGFYRALATTVEARGVTWKHVSAATGVSPSTLSRMARGRHPDAASLTALSVWAGIDPTQYHSTAKAPAHSLATVSRLLRQDPNLDRKAADAMDAILQAAYERLRTKPPSENE